MQLFSLSYLFFFLPTTAFVYYLVPRAYKVFVLFVASLYFYALLPSMLIGPQNWRVLPLNLIIMVACVITDYLLARPVFLYGKGSWQGRVALYAAAIKNILLFIILSSFGQLGVMIAPVGIAVYTFTSLGYLIDLYNGEADLVTSFYDYGVFCCFFGKIFVGPVVSCNDFLVQLRRPSFSLTKIGNGFVWLLHGLAKKVILADGALLLASQLSAIPYDDKTVLSMWMLLTCYIFATYFTLSGYSDLARGSGALLGLDLPENFHYPLQAQSVTDFFSRFNISAYRYVRKYVYGALGAEDNGKLATTLNIILITILMGLWYGISVNFLVWGASLGLIITLETLYGENVLHRIPAFFRRLYTFICIVISFVWFSTSRLGQSWFYLLTLFGLPRPQHNLFAPELFDNYSLYLLSSNWLLLLLCAFFCTNLVNTTSRRFMRNHPALADALSTVSNLLLFVLVLAFLV